MTVFLWLLSLYNILANIVSNTGGEQVKKFYFLPER